MNRSRAAAATLGEIGALALPGEAEKLHDATFEAPTDSPPEEPSQEAPVDVAPNLLDRKIDKLLDQIGEGLQADDATNFEKLSIARKNGALLWDLKALVPHGSFKAKLRERFPKVNYAKCNRWMFLSKQEEAVAAAIEKYPDLAWGPKKMIDYLKGTWTPEREVEDDEEEYCGYVREGHVEEEPLIEPTEQESEEIPEPDATSPFAVGALNPDLAKEIEGNQQASDDVPPGETAGPVTQAVRTAPRPGRNAPVKQPATNGTTVRPTANRTEYEVEVRLGFKFSVPEEVTPDEINEVLRDADRWTLGINAPFEYELSEKGVRVSHVRPWDGLDQFEPEVVPQAEAATE